MWFSYRYYSFDGRASDIIHWYSCRVAPPWSNLVRLQADGVVKDPCIHVCPLHRRKKVISQLMLGYTLNEYRYKIGLQKSPLCSCVAIHHIYINCWFPLYRWSVMEKQVTSTPPPNTWKWGGGGSGYLYLHY